MADAPVVHIGENSPEEVALKLTQIIASVEKRSLAGHVANTADRKWLLDTYAECLLAVKGISSSVTNMDYGFVAYIDTVWRS